jgi:hypothetical protein
MAEIPASWNLKTRNRSDGKLDVIGKTDLGEEYKVKTTAGPAITEKEIREIAATDREQTTAREFVSGVVSEQKKRDQQREAELEDDLSAVADEIVGRCTTDGRATRPGMLDLPLKCGMTTAYARGEQYWREVEEWKRRGCPLPTGD